MESLILGARCILGIVASAAVHSHAELAVAAPRAPAPLSTGGTTTAELGSAGGFGGFGGDNTLPGPAAAFRAGAQPWQLGVDLMVTFTARRVALYSYGFAGAYALAPWLTVGLNHVGVGVARVLRGDRIAITGGLYVELHYFFGDRLDPFAQVGVPLQLRLGSDIETRFGAAPYVGGGLRYWVTDIAALGALTRLHYAFTEYLLLNRVVPREAVIWMFGIATEVRL